MIQPAFDKPLSIGLTPSEIFDLTDSFGSGSTGVESLIDKSKELIVSVLECKNSRTGFSCRIAAIEGYITVDGEDISENSYLVELQIDGVYVYTDWVAPSGSDYDLAFIKMAAQKTFINWSLLIGVKVGYNLAVKPDSYLSL